MKVEITGRHIEITEPLKKFATDRLERMHGASDGILEVHMVLTVEKHQRHAAEANIKTQHDLFHGEEISSDMYTSIAAVLEKLEKQILRSKDKTISRKRHGGTTKETIEPEV